MNAILLLLCACIVSDPAPARKRPNRARGNAVELTLANIKNADRFRDRLVEAEGFLRVSFRSPTSDEAELLPPKTFAEWARLKRALLETCEFVIEKKKKTSDPIPVDIRDLPDVSLDCIDNNLTVRVRGRFVDGESVQLTAIEPARVDGIEYHALVGHPPEGVFAGRWQDYPVWIEVANGSLESVESALILVEASHQWTWFTGQTVLPVSDLKRRSKVDLTTTMKVWNEDKLSATTALEVAPKIRIYKGNPPSNWPGFLPPKNFDQRLNIPALEEVPRRDVIVVPPQFQHNIPPQMASEPIAPPVANVPNGTPRLQGDILQRLRLK